jgi:hypothetical protein
MVTRVLFILAGAVALVGVVSILLSLLSLFAAPNVDDGGGLIRGLTLLLVALVLLLLALAVRPAH